MKLKAAYEKRLIGTWADLQRATGCSYDTIYRARRGEPIYDFDSCLRIALACKGHVTIMELRYPEGPPTYARYISWDIIRRGDMLNPKDEGDAPE